MTRLLLHSARSLGLVVLAASVCLAGSVPVVNIIPSIGPAVDPSLTAYLTNAEYALEHGLTTYGGAGPTQYNVAPNPVSAAAVLSTAGKSWMGTPSPAAPYNNEYGNELFFGITVYSAAGFQMQDVSFSSPAYGVTNDLTGLSFDPWTIGVVGGTGSNCSGGTRLDGSLGHTGTDSTTINCLWYAGLALTAFESDPAATAAVLAADVASLAVGNAPTTYTLLSGPVTNPNSTEIIHATATPDLVSPEPATLVLLTFGFGAMLFGRKAVATRNR